MKPKFLINFSALGINNLTQIVIQIITVPLFLSKLSPNLYAQWIFAFNISQISSLLDLGAISACQNFFAYIKRSRDNNINDYSRQLHNILIINNLAFILILSLLNYFELLHLDITLLLIFVLSNYLQSLLGIFEAIMRADEMFAKGLYLSNSLKAAEFIGVICGVIIFPGSIFRIALLTFIPKLFIFLLIAFKIIGKPFFSGFSKFNIFIIFKLIQLGLPFLVIKISDILLYSGVVIILHGKLTSSELIYFVSVRTFFRYGVQFISLVTHSIGFEMTTSWAKNDYHRMVSLIRKNTIFSITLSLICATTYFLFGGHLFKFWTHNNLHLEGTTIFCGIFYSFVASLYQAERTKFYAVNLGNRNAYISLFTSLILIFLLGISNYQFKTSFLLLLLLSLSELVSFILMILFYRNRIEKHFRR